MDSILPAAALPSTLMSLAPAPPTEAAALDAADPLAAFRSQYLLEPGTIYLNGHSLSPPSRPALAAAQATLEQWQRLAIRGWTDPSSDWMTLAERLGAATAPLVGASADSIVVTGSSTANLHQSLCTLFAPAAGRDVVVTDALAFPSDVHAIESHLRTRGLDPATRLRKVPSRDGLSLSTDDVLATLDTPGVAMAVLPSVVFTGGQLLAMEPITRFARDRGIVIGWDCSHSVGIVPHRLDDIDADFAFWCSYKYLGGGPGAAGGIYLNRRHHHRSAGAAGWFGVEKSRMFGMNHAHEPAPGAARLQVGTPNILSMAPLLGSLELFNAAGVERIRAKSRRMVARLIDAATTRLAPLGVSVAPPTDPDQRGGHVALRHPRADRLCAALRERKIVGDFRHPDVLRLAPHPLYVSYAELDHAIDTLAMLLSGAVGERTQSVI